MSAREAVLFANAAFYLTFVSGDLEAMDASWARDVPVACIHPGWRALGSRVEIMESWRQIFANTAQPPVRCRAAEAFVLGEVAFATGYEEFGQDVLVATNIFCSRGGRWFMVHHQAGPSPGVPPERQGREPPARPH